MTAAAIEVFRFPFLSYPLLLRVTIAAAPVPPLFFFILAVLAIETDVGISLGVQGEGDEYIANDCGYDAYDGRPSAVNFVQGSQMEKVEQHGGVKSGGSETCEWREGKKFLACRCMSIGCL